MRHALAALAVLLFVVDSSHGIETSSCPPYLGEPRTLSGHSRLVRSLAYSPQGILASGGQDQRICLWSRNGALLNAVTLPSSGPG